MRTTLILDDELLEEARQLTGIEEKTALVHERLRALIHIEGSKRLAKLAGSAPSMEDIPRRRSQTA